MYTTFSKSKVALLACLVAIAFAGVASAFPSRGGGCTGCHSTPGGSLNFAPNPLNVELSANGLLTFNVTDVAGATGSDIAVQFSDVNLFNNVSAGAGGDTWTKRTTGGNSLVSNVFAGPLTLVLDLAVGAGAPTGSFPLTIWLGGSSDANGQIVTQYANALTLNVTEAIPEPATLAMFLLGIVGVSFRRSR